MPLFRRQPGSTGEIACRNVVLLAVLTALLLPVPGIAESGNNRRVTFAVGGAPAELDAWEEIARDFTDRTGIPVDLLRQPTDTDLRRQGLVVPLQARKADPDLFLMDVAWIAQFAASGWLAPLDDLAGAGGCAPRDRFFPRILDLADTWEARTVALPVYVDGGVLYYRTDLLRKYRIRKPPETWEEFLAAAVRVQKKMRGENRNFYGFVWQGAQYEGLICNFLEFAGEGGGFLREKERVVVDTPRNREALRFMRDLIHLQRVSPPNTFTEMTEEETRGAFQRGDALFERNWPYAWALHQAPDSPVRGVTGIARMPSFRGKESVSTLGGWHAGISRYSDAKEEARAFLCFLVSYETQKRLARKLGWNPGRRDVYRDPEVVAALPHLTQLEAVFERAVPRPVLPYYPRISEILQRHLNAALANRADPGKALAAAQKEIDRIVSRYGQR